MRKKDIKTNKDLEIYYSKCRKIKFNDKIKINNRTEILNLLTSKYATYHIKNKQHCPSSRNRSLDDFLRLCKFYFPIHTIKENIKFFKRYVEDYDIYIGYCPNIKKLNMQGNIWYSSFKYPEKLQLGEGLVVDKNGNVIL